MQRCKAGIGDLPRRLHRFGVAVQSHQPPAVAQAQQDLAAVAASAKGTVGINSICFDLQRVYCFPQQYGQVRQRFLDRRTLVLSPQTR